MRVAVIGAGVAGLSCARDLAAAGVEVVVHDKGRRVGGRTSTRRHDGLAFDHGAVVVPAELDVDGLVALHPFPGGAVPAGSMRALCEALADGLDVRLEDRVTDLAALEADAVVVTAPAPQAAELFAPVAPALADLAASVGYDPCWAVMAAWDAPLRDVVLPEGVWRAVREAEKPGRAPGERWTVQAAAWWSTEHVDDDPDDVCRALLDGLPAPSFCAAHRWLYAVPAWPLDDLVVQQGRYVGAGDWCGGRDVVAARASGRAAAAALR